MATVKLYLRKKKLNNGLFPVVLRITHLRKKNIISLNFKCKKEDWNERKEEFRKSFPDSKNQNNILHSIKNRAETIIRQYEYDEIDFDFKKFKEDLFHYKVSSSEGVFEFWETHIENLYKSKKAGNARYHHDCKTSFFNFINNKNLSFKNINYSLLKDYENHLGSRGCIPNGIAVRMRALRAIYNEAIKQEIANQNDYPFKKYKISKLKGKTNKRALSHEEILQIKSLDLTKNSHLIDARNYFIFSYYTRGMNFIDMLLLKWKDISTNSIVYIRNKTKERFVIKRSKIINKILKYYQDNNNLDTEYVFPLLLKDNLTERQIQNRKHKTLSKFNKDLKEIAKLCDIEKTLTSYVARHSFATNLKHKGVSTDIISEALGHKNLAITQTYLKDFENKTIDDAVSILEV